MQGCSLSAWTKISSCGVHDDIWKPSVTGAEFYLWWNQIFYINLWSLTLLSFRINQSEVFNLIRWMAISGQSWGSWKNAKNHNLKNSYYKLYIKNNVSFYCSTVESIYLKTMLIIKIYFEWIILFICGSLNKRHAVTQKTIKCFFVKLKLTIIPWNVHRSSLYHSIEI